MCGRKNYLSNDTHIRRIFKYSLMLLKLELDGIDMYVILVFWYSSFDLVRHFMAFSPFTL